MRSARNAALRALRAVAARACRVCAPAAAAHRILLRSRAHRVAILRRLRRAGERRDPARSVAAGYRRGVESDRFAAAMTPRRFDPIRTDKSGAAPHIDY